jgi:AraC-like DNA-binding protein
MQQPTPLHLVFDDRVQKLFDHFCSLLSIRIAFFNTTLREVVVGLGKPSCRYCRLLRQRMGLDARCREQDRVRLTDAARTGKLVSYRCHGGLDEAIVPVSLAGRHIGYAMIGQFRSSHAIPSRYARSWRRDFADSPELESAFEAVPYFPRAKVADILGMFEVLVTSIVAQGLVAPKSDDALQRILAVLHDRPDEPLTLSEAARLAGRSASSVSHLFTERTGRSFKRTQVEARIAAAERMLRGEPGVSVKEVAYRLGYDDPLYFSRIFRKYRGVPPSAVRPRPPARS